MFYNFNRHKQAAKPTLPAGQDWATKFSQRSNAAARQLSKRLAIEVSRLPAPLQRAAFITVLGIGLGYCINLVLPSSLLTSGNLSLSGVMKLQNTIQAATPSPRQQAFEQYVDSLERAFIADSIQQFQQNTSDHADKSVHP